MTRQAAYGRGKAAEDKAVLWLKLKGYSILARGYTPGRGTGAGEIDIIARRGRLVAFIEVKARPQWEEAVAAISPAQCRRIANSAAAFMAGRPDLADCDWRFDAMLICPNHVPRHLPDAWRPDA